MNESMTNLLLMSAAIAIGFLAAVAFYESMSTRDVLVRRTMRVARRVSRRRWLHGAMYLVTVFIGIPFLVVVWTLVLELFLLVVGSAERLGNLGTVAVAIVAATRILTYVREKTAHELAKAIPLALAFALITGGALRIDENLTAIARNPDVFSLQDAELLFLVLLELGLRAVTDGSGALLAAIRRRRGIDSELGFWRTLAAAVARPVAPAVEIVGVGDEPAIGGEPALRDERSA